MGWIVHLVAAVVLIGVSACGGQPPTAKRVAPDTNDRYYPRGEVRFVEHGQRLSGVLVSATAGFDNPFSASWRTVLVPTSPAPASAGGDGGPVWTGKKPSRADATTMANLDGARNTFYVGLYADLVRGRFDAPALWVLGTDPFVLGLPAGDKPLRSWRDYAAAETGGGGGTTPIPSLTSRYVVDGELKQPLAKLILFPTDLWTSHQAQTFADVKLRVVTLDSPMTIDDALNALAAGDAARLGRVGPGDMKTFYDTKANARHTQADRERLQSQ